MDDAISFPYPVTFRGSTLCAAQTAAAVAPALEPSRIYAPNRFGADSVFYSNTYEAKYDMIFLMSLCLITKPPAVYGTYPIL